MHGTLTIQGELEELSDIAREISARYPAAAASTAMVPARVAGYDFAGARVYLDAVPPNTRRAVEMVVERGGWCSAEELRRELGDSLRGKITPASTRQVNRLRRRGLLPDEARSPVRAGYGRAGGGWRRTDGISMAADLVPIFADALS